MDDQRDVDTPAAGLLRQPRPSGPSPDRESMTGGSRGSLPQPRTPIGFRLLEIVLRDDAGGSASKFGGQRDCTVGVGRCTSLGPTCAGAISRWSIVLAFEGYSQLLLRTPDASNASRLPSRSTCKRRHSWSGSDGTPTRDLRRDRPEIAADSRIYGRFGRSNGP